MNPPSPPVAEPSPTVFPSAQSKFRNVTCKDKNAKNPPVVPLLLARSLSLSLSLSLSFSLSLSSAQKLVPRSDKNGN